MRRITLIGPQTEAEKTEKQTTMKSLHPESLRCSATEDSNLQTKNWNISTNRYIFATELIFSPLKTSRMAINQRLPIQRRSFRNRFIAGRVAWMSLVLMLLASVFTVSEIGRAHV